MSGVETVRAVALTLPRSHEALVRGRVKFRVGRIVYLAFSREQDLMGFAFPKEYRQALVDSEPDKFLMPSLSDQRFHWVVGRLAFIDDEELRHIVIDAWAMCVPKFLSAPYRAGP